MSFVTIASSPDLFEANLMKFRLEHEGIECYLLDEHLGSIRPHLAGLSTSGIRLQVVEQDVEVAMKILKEANYYNDDYPSNSASTNKNIKRYFVPLALILITLFMLLLLIADAPWR